MKNMKLQKTPLFSSKYTFMKRFLLCVISYYSYMILQLEKYSLYF